MKGFSDAELVIRTRNGDKEAFGHLVERYEQTAHNIARNMVGDQFQELVQESMLQAYLSLRNLREPDRFRAWLLGIVRNLCKRHLSRRKTPDLSLEVLSKGEYRVDANGFNGVPSSP